MTTKKILFLLTIISLSVIYSCVKDEKEAPIIIDYAYEYYPLTIGKYRVFQMDSIVFDTIAGKTLSDSIRSYLREETLDTFVNDKGATVYRIERMTRKKQTDTWMFKDVVTAERDKIRGIRTENNFRLVKVLFPPKTRTFWFSTQYIDPKVAVKAGKKEIEMFSNWESEVISIGSPETVLNKKFDKVLVINQAADENLLELRRVTEKYAAGIGLISNEMQILDSQAASSSASWRKKAQKGFILRQYLIEYN
jgi:hypothetical protein